MAKLNRLGHFHISGCDSALVPHATPTLVSSSRRAAEVMSVVGLTTTGDSVMTSATLHRDKTVFEASCLAGNSHCAMRSSRLVLMFLTDTAFRLG